MNMVFEFRDYVEMKPYLDDINEGLFGKMWEKVKGFFKGTNSKIANLIAPEEVDRMIDKRTGQLTGNIVDQERLADTNVPLQQVFADIKANVKTGKFFLTGLQFLEDSLENADKKYQLSIPTKELEKGKGKVQPETTMKSGLGKGLASRGKEFEDQFRGNVQKMKKNSETEVSQYISKIGKDKMPTAQLMAQTRFLNAQNVLLLLEYIVKKRRFNVADLQDLSNGMVNSYKETLKIEKELSDNLKQVEQEAAAGKIQPEPEPAPETPGAEATPEATPQNAPAPAGETAKTEASTADTVKKAPPPPPPKPPIPSNKPADTAKKEEPVKPAPKPKAGAKEEIEAKYNIGQEINYLVAKGKPNQREIRVKLHEFTPEGVIVSTVAKGKKETGNKYNVPYETFKNGSSSVKSIDAQSASALK